MCLPGLFSSPSSSPPPPPAKVDLPPAPPAPSPFDMKKQAEAAPALSTQIGQSMRKRSRKSLTISSIIGTPGLGGM